MSLVVAHVAEHQDQKMSWLASLVCPIVTSEACFAVLRLVPAFARKILGPS